MSLTEKLLEKPPAPIEVPALNNSAEHIYRPTHIDGGPTHGKRILEPDIESAKYQSLASLESRNACQPEAEEIAALKKNERVAEATETTQLQPQKLTDKELSVLKKNVESTEATEILAQAQEGLTDDEKARIKEETRWSDEIIDAISTMSEYEIYKNAGVIETEINGRECLIKEIDLDYVDEKTGLTNRELMERGRSPVDKKTGEKIELHHMGQKSNAPFAELAENSEHGNGNHSTLHPKTEGSWRNDPEAVRDYQKERQEHWKTRSMNEA